MHRYLKAGADLSFVESPVSVEQMQRITRDTAAPNMAKMLSGGRTPILTARELQDLGFPIAAYPTMLAYVTAGAAERSLAHLRDHESLAGLGDAMEFDEFNEVIGLEDLRRKETAYYRGPRR